MQDFSLASIIFNAGKHHLATIVNNLRQYAVEGEEKAQVGQKLREEGEGVMDIYEGSLSVEQIKNEVWEFLQKNQLLDCESYRKYLENLGSLKVAGYYVNLTLSDGSVVTLRLGDTADSFVHVHPGRHTPYTFRVKAKTFKTAALVAFLSLCRHQSPYDLSLVNESRKMLSLSPVNDQIDAIYELLEKLGFSR